MLTYLIALFSTIWKLRKVVGWVLHYQRCLRQKSQRRSHPTDSTEPAKFIPCRTLPVEILKEADQNLIKHEQDQYFSKELQSLTNGHDHVNRSSNVYKLNPVLQDGILRVGGRIRHSDLSFFQVYSSLMTTMPDGDGVWYNILRIYSGRDG